MSTRVGAAAAVSALVLIAGSASAAPQRSAAPSAAEIVFVDVAAGDGVVIRVGGAVVAERHRRAEHPLRLRAIDKALAKTGSREIEAIIVSHAHDDHVKNVSLLLESGKYKIKRALLSRNAHWSATDANRAVMSAIRRHRIPLELRADGAGLPLRRSEVDDPQPGPRRLYEAPPGLQQLGRLRPRGERQAAPLHRRHRDGRRASRRLGVAATGARLRGCSARHAPRLEVRVP